MRDNQGADAVGPRCGGMDATGPRWQPFLSEFASNFVVFQLPWPLLLLSSRGANMPSVYDKMGVRFLFPDNWTLDESDVLDGNSTVSVYSPGGAFWSIILHPPELDPDDLVEAAVDAMRQEYDELD